MDAARRKVADALIHGKALRLEGGAVLGLKAAGIKVYRASGGTVADAVRQFKATALPEIEEDGACAGHGEGHSCHKS